MRSFARNFADRARSAKRHTLGIGREAVLEEGQPLRRAPVLDQARDEAFRLAPSRPRDADEIVKIGVAFPCVSQDEIAR